MIGGVQNKTITFSKIESEMLYNASFARPNTVYQCSVSAKTSVGYGAPATVKITTLEAGTVTRFFVYDSIFPLFWKLLYSMLA